MRTLFRRRPSPAMMVACAALFVALAGTSIAAVSALPRASVGPLQLQNGAVTAPKLRNGAVSKLKLRKGAVTSSEVQDFSLLRRDFRPGQLPAGPTGPQGPVGPIGPAGAAGAAGPAGVIGAITVRTASVLIDGGTGENGAYLTDDVSKDCDSGERAISAGTSWSDTDANLELFVQSMAPHIVSGNVVGFTAVGGNDSGQSSTLTLHVLCYKA